MSADERDVTAGNGQAEPGSTPAFSGDGGGPAWRQLVDQPSSEDGGDSTSGDLNDPALYLNREISLLRFQERVLDEAFDPDLPVLDRLKFLSIVGSNLDEFFMVRVGGLKLQLAEGVVERSPDGRTPAEQLAEIRQFSHEIMKASKRCLLEELMPLLADEGIHLLNYEELSEKQRSQMSDYFDAVIFPVLTPMAFDPGHPFPHISNLSLNLAVVIRDQAGEERFARVKVPASIPRFVPLKRSSGSVRKDGTAPRKHYFVWVEQVVAANLQRLFPGMEIVASYPFRVTRNADMIIQELEADDLLETMEQSVRQRRFGSVDRVTFNPGMPEDIRQILVKNLRVDNKDVYELDGPLGTSGLMSLYESVERPDLKEHPFIPFTLPHLRLEDSKSSIFDRIARKSTLIHHPYDSFAPVVDFLFAAANDPNVLAIKQTLYRVGKNAPVVRALLKARENGKQVTALVELKARFDEESNIEWAKTLEREGVHVVYGLLGLKTHSKLAMVVRKEDDKMRRYVHLSTGNYNVVTSHIYEDLGFFTCDEDIGADVTDIFNYLTGYSAKKDYRKLIVAPIKLRANLEGRIEREIEHARAGRGGHIIIKSNALVDKSLIRLFYRASMEGVKIELIIRGICCLRPGIEGISENITVRSIVGRFLEHSRIYYFANGGDPDVYLGSADMMPRNIDRRVEVLFPIEEADHIHRIRNEILDVYFADNVKARLLQSDGSYVRASAGEDDEVVSVQDHFLKQRIAWQNDDALVPGSS
ncbi:MAG: polyphosphate kinase 1 [Rhodothermia bacterium]|nr:polyphosphate kinase 1 [Rhodothermia bacterium]